MSITTSEELDDLLISYFELLDRYSTLQSILHDILKQAHFQLAKAKLALGPTRVDENGWDLRDLKAGWFVDLENSEAEEELIPQKPKGPKDPLHQFSAFPPPSLRASQVEFRKASKTICEVLELRERMRVLEERIQVVKGGVDVAK
ncbi:hypothetical protein T439DRAFT_321649 [Meredithblackwellia eburnea MCA 4105]